MGDILNITNFHRYTGKYTRRSKATTPEEKIGWYIYDGICEKLPITALRNREPDENWPLNWKFSRNFKIASDVVLSTLIAWNAFRPMGLDTVKPRIDKILIPIAKRFQNDMLSMDAYNIHDAIKIDAQKTIISLARSVGQLSQAKSFGAPPMMGSKILHFLFPEWFPVWDTAWVKEVALNNEDLEDDALSKWLSNEIIRKLMSEDSSKTCLEYGKYVCLMIKELNETSNDEYKKIENSFIKYSEIPEEIFNWHFEDLAPILFETCLLGKHCASS